jgi:hypothetical protein
MNHAEYVLSCKVATILDAAGLLYTHVPLEESDPKRVAFEHRMGVRKGCPDFIVFEQPPLALELKTPKGRVTDEQARWLEDLTRKGWRTAVCRSAAEVLALLREVYGERIYEGVEG